MFFTQNTNVTLAGSDLLQRVQDLVKEEQRFSHTSDQLRKLLNISDRATTEKQVDPKLLSASSSASSNDRNNSAIAPATECHIKHQEAPVTSEIEVLSSNKHIVPKYVCICV